MGRGMCQQKCTEAAAEAPLPAAVAAAAADAEPDELAAAAADAATCMVSLGHCIRTAATLITCTYSCAQETESIFAMMDSRMYKARTWPVDDTETLADTATDAPPATVALPFQVRTLTLKDHSGITMGDSKAAPHKIHGQACNASA